MLFSKHHSRLVNHIVIQIAKGRSGVIEGVQLQPEPEAVSGQKKRQFATSIGGEAWLQLGCA